MARRQAIRTIGEVPTYYARARFSPTQLGPDIEAFDAPVPHSYGAPFQLRPIPIAPVQWRPVYYLPAHCIQFELEFVMTSVAYKSRSIARHAFLGIFLLTGAAPSFLSAQPQTVAPDVARGTSVVTANLLEKLRVSKAHSHKNLTVFLIHSAERDDREFITLNEGLKSGQVVVSELDQERVRSLTVENKSDKPLFLQEGDRVTGGKQDRTLYSSLVIAPKSGKQPIPTFCIEQSRWQLGATGRQFFGNANRGYASNSVRKAAKIQAAQGRVWEKVARQKALLQKKAGIASKTSSLNEAIDSKEIVASTKGYQDALGKILADHKDVVGMAFAVDGMLLEANVYPGYPLAKKVYPRLLETYAVDASLTKKEKQQPAPPKAGAVKELMASKMQAQPQRDEKLDDQNRLQVFASKRADAAKQYIYRCETTCDNSLVHLQWLKAEKLAATPERQRGQPGQRAQRAQQVLPLGSGRSNARNAEQRQQTDGQQNASQTD